MKRGTIIWINLEDADPPEMGKTRPAILVSNTEHNHTLSTVVVVPLSSRAPEIWPLRLRLETPRLKTSFAVTPGLSQVSRARLLQPIGMASSEFLDALDEALAAYLDL